MLVTAGALYGATASDAFAGRRVDIEGATWTGREAVMRALGSATGSNLFGLRTAPLAANLAALPAVRSASVDVALPDGLRVALVERTPLLLWQIGDRTMLVDGEGMLFATLGETPPASAADLPRVVDERAASATIEVGERLDPVDLDAATRLGSLVPADVGSAAAGLDLSVDDKQGYIVRAGPEGWTAVFGFYTPMLRTPELIPGQVRLLRSLIIGREPQVDRIILADDRNGTYVPRSAPASPSPSAGG
jgi:hypothetical protein